MHVFIKGRSHLAKKITNVTIASTTENIILRINDFTNPQAEEFAGGFSSGLVALTFDKNNDILYFATSSTVYKKEADSGSGATTVSTPGSTIRGLTIADDGYLYVARNTEITRIDPATGSSAAFITGLGTAWDVMYKEGYLYVANFASGTENKVIQYTLTGTKTAEFHTPSGSADEFKGPRRFLAGYNIKFILMSATLPKLSFLKWLTSFNDMEGSEWDTFYPSEIGETDFRFFYFC